MKLKVNSNRKKARSALAWGKVTGNTGQIIRGEAEKVKRKIQEDVGKVKRKL